MTPQQRIRLARRHAGLSQSALAAPSACSAARSATGRPRRQVSQRGPHARTGLGLTGVQFEWLATGRGKMSLSSDTALDSVAAADALLIDDPLELRLLLAFRDAPTRSRAPAGGSGRAAGFTAHGPQDRQRALRRRHAAVPNARCHMGWLQSPLLPGRSSSDMQSVIRRAARHPLAGACAAAFALLPWRRRPRSSSTRSTTTNPGQRHRRTHRDRRHRRREPRHLPHLSLQRHHPVGRHLLRQRPACRPAAW